MHREVIDEIARRIAQHQAEVTPALSCLTAAKCLERIASHALNIGRATLFVVSHGDMPR
jgi:phosphate uptake regulator